MLGPRKSYSMETKPLAMLLIIMAMVKGIRAKGRGRIVGGGSSSMLLRTDAAAHHHAEAFVIYRLKIDPGVAKAILAAAIANCAKRSARRASLGDLKYLVGSKPATSPAILQS